MNILISGNPDSIYLYYYFQYVLLDDKMKNNTFVLLDLENHPIREQYQKFYRENQIDVIQVGDIPKWILKIPKARGLYYRCLRNHLIARMMRRYGGFDFWHLHYVDPRLEKFMKRYRGRLGQIIATFWGSDIYRCRTQDVLALKSILEESKWIVLDTKDMYDRVHDLFGCELDDRFCSIFFGAPVLEDIKQLMAMETRDYTKKCVSLPAEKVIVTCGYNANPAQQHEIIIRAISRCKPEILEKAYFVFPCAYGGTSADIDRIRSLLFKTNCQYCVDTKYYNGIDMARMRRSSDIFIHAQISDGFSASIVEHLFCGNILLNGSWVQYPALKEKDVYYREFHSAEDLSEQLMFVIEHLQKEKERIQNSKDVLYQMCSWSCVKEQWIQLYQMEENKNETGIIKKDPE